MRTVSLFTFALSLLLSACGNFEAELYVNADGSGESSFMYDGSDLMGMFAMMGGSEEMPTEDLKIGDVDLMEAFTSAEASIDTLITMRDLMTMSDTSFLHSEANFKAAVKNAGRSYDPAEFKRLQAELDKLRNSYMALRIDAGEQVMLMGSKERFRKTEDLEVTAQAMAKISQVSQELMGAGGDATGMSPLAGQMSPGGQLFMPKLYKNQLRIDLNTSSISQLMEALNKASGEEESEGEENEMASLMGGNMAEMLGLNNLSFTVHVPGKISSVSGAPHSKLDENTVVFTLDLTDPDLLNKSRTLQIDFKKSKKYSKTIEL